MRRHPYLAMFCVCAGVYLLALKTEFGYDGQIMFRITESLAMHHSLRIADPVWHLNEPYATYGLGVSLLLLPFFWLGQLLMHDGTRLVVLYEPIVTASSVTVLCRLLGELGCSWPRRVLVSAIYAFATLAWYYSTTIFSEPLVALALVLSLLGFVRYRQTADIRALLLTGIAVSVAVVARVDTALLVALPCAAYAIYVVTTVQSSRGQRVIAPVAFSAPMVVGVAIDLAYNWERSGSLFAAGRLPYPGTFHTPVWTGLYGLLFSPGAGLLIYCPIVIVGLVAGWWFGRHHPREAILVAAIVAVRLLFYARWDGWMGMDWGSRFLVPVLPLLVLPLAFLPGRRWLQVAAAAAAAAGILIEILGQLVPYSTVFWPRSAPAVAAALNLPAPGGCVCSSDVDLRVHEAMALNWQFSPLHGQWVILISGSNIAWSYLVLLAAAFGVGFLVLQRIATAAQPSPAGRAEAPLDEVAA